MTGPSRTFPQSHAIREARVTGTPRRGHFRGIGFCRCGARLAVFASSIAGALIGIARAQRQHAASKNGEGRA